MHVIDVWRGGQQIAVAKVALVAGEPHRLFPIEPSLGLLRPVASLDPERRELPRRSRVAVRARYQPRAPQMIEVELSPPSLLPHPVPAHQCSSPVHIVLHPQPVHRAERLRALILPQHFRPKSRRLRGLLRAERIKGSLDVDNANGGVSASDIGGSARVRTSFGSVFLKGVNGAVTVENENGSIGV